MAKLMKTLNGYEITDQAARNNINDLQSKINNINFSNIWPDGAGAHNSVNRGKKLGSSVSTTQLANIRNGTFKDLFPGDYWTINGEKWYIGECDRYLNTGDGTPSGLLTKHHLVIFPAEEMQESQMMSTPSSQHIESYDNTNTAYIGSSMRTDILPKMKINISNRFPNIIITYKQIFPNAANNGNPTNILWVNACVELMNESMVYGAPILEAGVSSYGNFYYRHTLDKTQLAAFRNDPSLILAGNYWWLRDTVTSRFFAYVDKNGHCNCDGASFPLGVRPYFLIG